MNNPIFIKRRDASAKLGWLFLISLLVLLVGFLVGCVSAEKRSVGMTPTPSMRGRLATDGKPGAIPYVSGLSSKPGAKGFAYGINSTPSLSEAALQAAASSPGSLPAPDEELWVITRSISDNGQRD